jgi:hypothetical protein
MSKQVVFDAAKVREAILAGHEAEIFAALADAGVTFDSRLGKVGFLKLSAAATKLRVTDAGMVCDAQPELATVSNAGIPQWLTNYFDPKLIEILFSPLRATEIVGSEVQKGDFTTDTVTFSTVESVGEVSSYGDYNNNGMTKANVNFPQRQSYLYQAFTQWGEREMERYAKARVDWANQQSQASVKVLNRFQNDSYFFGISGLENYGLLTDPALYAPIAATVSWQTATPNQVYEDVRRMFAQLQLQSNGVIDADTAMTLALSPVTNTALDKADATFYGRTVRMTLKTNYPNLEIKTAVQYSTASGELVQLIAREFDGVRTAETAYSVKMRAHAVVVGHSSWSQKKSQSTFGTVIYRPFAIAQLIGA